MSKISEAANKTLNTVLFAAQVFKQYGGIVTFNGLGYSMLKTNQGVKKTAVLYFAEGSGMWVTNKAPQDFVDELLNLYEGDIDAINEDFKHTGIKVQIGPKMKLSGGNDYWPMVKIGEVNFDVQPEALADDDEPPCDSETGEVKESAPF